MPAIARGEENTVGNVNWFTTLNYVLADMAVVEFRILDITGGLPGSQVFPPSGWEDVSAAPGKFGTGSYYAYDNGNARGWTPELTANLGTHRVEWRWKLEAGSAYQYGAEDIEVTEQPVISIADYLTLQDLYNLVGPARVSQYFDDDLSGDLASENEPVQAILKAAEAEAYSRLMRHWSVEQVEALAGVDQGFRNHVAWVALEFASERRPAFHADDGKGAFWAQYERAIAFFEKLSKGRLRSKGEGTIGQGANTGGNLRPTSSAKTASSFVFAPSEKAPTGHGGFVWPLLFFTAHAVRYAMMMVT